MTKILHLNPQINLTCGVSKSIYSIITNTNETYENYVFCLGGDGIDKYNRAGIKTVVHSPKNRTLLRSIAIFFNLFNLIREHHFDIIHSHHRYFDFITFIIARFLKIKTVTSVQSKVIGKKLFSYKSDFLIACSNSIKEHLVNYFRIDSDRITVIHNFVDPKAVVLTKERSALKKELGLNDSTILIGFIGRFNILEKGIDILLEAFRKISQEYSNLKLLMIGEGEDKNYISDFISKYNLNAVTLPPKENIFDYFNIIDIVVLPSRVEPFGIVAIEAGLMKKAFIGSEVDGLMAIINDSVNGVLFPPQNVESLTTSFQKLVKNEELRNEYGEKLYQKVIDHFTNEKIIPLYEKTYQQILA